MSAEAKARALRECVPVSGDGLTIMRAHEVAYFRLTDRFGHLGGMLFLFGMFHFYWFCLCILFQIMWLFGFEVLVARLNKAKRVTKECKKFNDADQFFTLVYDSFFLYALDEFSLQYENLGPRPTHQYRNNRPIASPQ